MSRCLRCAKLEDELLKAARGSVGKYRTEEERLEARRRSWRESKRRRRAEYLRLCAHYKQKPRRKWTTHFGELRARWDNEPENFWRSRFTQAEIDEIWRDLSLFLNDESEVAA